MLNYLFIKYIRYLVNEINTVRIMSTLHLNHLIMCLAIINQATIKKSGKGVIDVTLLTFTRRYWD